MRRQAGSDWSSLAHAERWEAGAIAYGAVGRAVCWPLLVQAEHPQALLRHCQSSETFNAAQALRQCLAAPRQPLCLCIADHAGPGDEHFSFALHAWGGNASGDLSR